MLLNIVIGDHRITSISSSFEHLDTGQDPVGVICIPFTIRQSTLAELSLLRDLELSVVKLYNRQLKISQQGEFRKGRLSDGKRYTYDSDGILTRIQVFKGGRYAGDAMITDDDIQ